MRNSSYRLKTRLDKIGLQVRVLVSGYRNDCKITQPSTSQEFRHLL